MRWNVISKDSLTEPRLHAYALKNAKGSRVPWRLRFAARVTELRPRRSSATRAEPAPRARDARRPLAVAGRAKGRQESPASPSPIVASADRRRRTERRF